ncbi:heat shock protein Hsp90 [Ectocarpus siliculosus]|uniref:Heat shock protein Hsp90 n=1 Tax=Ectocarpus siliculosus TaxID=2880 RepID=D7FVX2_ECTSI|nr:heat shock protein Hsp90 [Ectocarpus siliculosus]|eukprot:CBJ25492.1 heat shock protein Hsp90 [Ectocarpus siliculosus]
MMLRAVSGPLRRAASSSTTRPHPPQCARDTARRIACRASAKSDAAPAALGATLGSRGEESLRRQRRSPVMPTCWGVRGLSASSAQEEEKLEFQAETRQLLDIVTHSIYTDKEVFLRELISNASDAMEKLRHLQVVGEAIEEGSAPSEIMIATDEKEKTITIQDTGIGMTREELKLNLGTIARSGSKSFLKELNEAAGDGKDGDSPSGALEGIIGQFGVGFYSAFMVGDTVTVHTRSARDGSRSVWTSDGSGEFVVKEAEAVAEGEEEMPRGCKIVVKLRDGCEEYATQARVEEVVQKYSNFVGVPIKLNGEEVNTVEAIWMKSPSEVEDAKYDEFYKFIAKAYDEPLTKLHFRTDAPIELKALFFFPSYHTEKFGMARLEPGVSLYSRKVLIEAKCPDLLPEWLRFVKGVVDSEDLPLSLSREKPQDTALLGKIGGVLTKKIIRFLQEMMRKEPEKYRTQFFAEFGAFLKEGVCQDFTHQGEIAKLLYFESNKGEKDELCSLDEYVSRCTPEQKEIYYLCAPNRELAMASPYYEAFGDSGREILFVYNTIDDFVMNNLKTYAGRPIKSAEAEDIELGGDDAAAKDSDEEEDRTAVAGLTSEDAEDLCSWLKESALPERVFEAKVTTRLKDSPAIISSHESAALRRMMRMIEQQNSGSAAALPKQKVEINPKHPLMTKLHVIKTSNPLLAQMIAEQVFDNALVAAGLMDDSRVMLPRVNDLMAKVLADVPLPTGSAGAGKAKKSKKKSNEKAANKEPTATSADAAASAADAKSETPST